MKNEEGLLRLLSIDWDYFVPTKEFDPEQWQLYDWTMKDNAFYRDPGLWIHRAVGFIQNGLPLPETSGLEKTFWGRFRFAPGAKLYYGDSHLYAATIPGKELVHEVWNYDAHHDLGYRATREAILDSRQVTCDNWLAWYKHAGARVWVYYPQWKDMAIDGKPVFPGFRKNDDGKPVSQLFDAVYVCRSSSWTPPWLDAQFRAFLEACPVAGPVNLQEDGYDALQPRQWSQEMVQTALDQWAALRRLQELRRQGLLDPQLELWARGESEGVKT